MTALPDRKPTTAAPSTPATDASEQVLTAIAGMQQSLSIQMSQEIAARVADAVQAGTRASAAGVFHAVASLLAVRFLLLLALLGGFALAFMALRAGSYEAAGVLIAYAMLIVIPLIYLERYPRSAS